MEQRLSILEQLARTHEDKLYEVADALLVSSNADSRDRIFGTAQAGFMECFENRQENRPDPLGPLNQLRIQQQLSINESDSDIRTHSRKYTDSIHTFNIGDGESTNPLKKVKEREHMDLKKKLDEIDTNIREIRF